MEMLSDVAWSRNPYANQLFHVSSPTTLIYDSYYANVVYSLFRGYVDHDFSAIVVYSPNCSEFDKVTKAILATVSLAGIPVRYASTIRISKPEISRRDLRVATKRALLDEFVPSSNGLHILYEWDMKILLHEDRDLNQFIADEERILECGIEQTTFVQAVIAEAIRQQKFNIAEKYLTEFASLTEDEYAYINKQAFLLLRRDGVESAINYLRTLIDVDQYVDRRKVDFSQSLVMKNYASLLSVSNELKRTIMRECLKDTPQDVDLWISFYNSYPDEADMKERFVNILEHGVVRKEIVNRLGEQHLSNCCLVKAALCSLRHGEFEYVSAIHSYLRKTDIGALVLRVMEAMGGLR